METNLFTELSPFLDAVDITLQITKKGEEYTVAFFQKPRVDDSAKNRIPPVINRSNDLHELDEKFLEAISTPLKQVHEWTTSTKDFEQKMKQAQANSDRAAKEQKEKFDKKNKVTTKLKKAKDLINDLKNADAMKHIKSALELIPDHAEALKLKKETEIILSGTGDLFGS